MIFFTASSPDSGSPLRRHPCLSLRSLLTATGSRAAPSWLCLRRGPAQAPSDLLPRYGVQLSFHRIYNSRMFVL